MPGATEHLDRSYGTPGLRKGSIFCVALLLGYLFLLCDKAFLAAGGSDSSGYLNSAKLFSRGKLTDTVEPLGRLGLSQEFARVFIPLGFSPGSKPGTMVPSYPPGLPLHLAAAALVGGWARAPFWVSPLAATICLLLVYGIGREVGMSRALAVAAAACLAVFERRTLLRVVLGGLPFAAFLFLTNQIANGSPFRSGYGNMSDGFSLGFFPVRIRHYGYWLGTLGTRLRRDPGFRPADQPEGPVRTSRSPKISALRLSVVVLATGTFWICRFHLVDSARDEEIYPDTCRWAAAQVPPKSVIAAMQMTGAMRYYTDLTFARIDWIEPAVFPSLRSRVEAAGYRWYALVSPAEKDLLQKNLPGSWKELARLRDQTLLRLDDTASGDFPQSIPSAASDSGRPGCDRLATFDCQRAALRLHLPPPISNGINK